MKEKLWGGRFTKNINLLVEEFTSSIDIDKELALYDILGSMAHVKMLTKCGLLCNDEEEQLIIGLKSLEEKIQTKNILFSKQHEDIHLNIEYLLRQEIGSVAGKLHTGRSRNDQVALDLHLYLRDQLLNLVAQLLELQAVLMMMAKSHLETIMPGYTHLQQAQPVSFAHHLLAYFSMLQRDVERLINSWSHINLMPLGAGALAGTTLEIDREYVAEFLKFDGVYENSMDAVSDRDFIVVFLAHASLMMMHLSRFSEEIILWCSDEFAYIELDDSFCTGSSMMPQKKNPDVAELTRGKSGRVYGALIAILTVLKALPLCYNRDMQEDKQLLFDTVKTLTSTLKVFTPMLATMKVNVDTLFNSAQKGFMGATDLADYLVRKKLAFREAHEVIGKIVQYCLKQQCSLSDLSLAEYHLFSPLFESDLYEVIDVRNMVNSRNVTGGTGKTALEKQIQAGTKKMTMTSAWLKSRKEQIEIGEYSGSPLPLVGEG